MRKAIEEGTPYKRPYRFVMAILFVSVNFCAMLPYIAPSIFMGDIMESFGVGLDLAGLSMNLQLVVSGACFFIGSFIVDRFGMLKTSLMLMSSLLLGVLVSAFAPNITVYLIGRAIAGFGQGLGVGLTSFISTWFEGKGLSMMITINSIVSAVAIALSLAFSRTLANLTGSWQGAITIYAVITAIFTVLWFLLGRNSPEGEAQEAAQAKQRTAGEGKSSLVLAMKELQYWKVTIYVVLFTVVNTSVATFLPTYMISELGVPEGLATAANSIQSILGMVGSLLGGILVTRIWRRRPILYIGITVYAVCGILLTLIPSDIVRAALCVILGFLFYLPITAQSQLIIETALAKNPAMISGGMAMANGTGMLLTIFVSPLFTAIQTNSSMTQAYQLFFAACAIGAIAAFTLKETGKRPN